MNKRVEPRGPRRRALGYSPAVEEYCGYDYEEGSVLECACCFPSNRVATWLVMAAFQCALTSAPGRAKMLYYTSTSTVLSDGCVYLVSNEILSHDRG